jgi:hypothetical protein
VSSRSVVLAKCKSLEPSRRSARSAVRGRSRPADAPHVRFRVEGSTLSKSATGRDRQFASARSGHPNRGCRGNAAPILLSVSDVPAIGRPRDRLRVKALPKSNAASGTAMCRRAAFRRASPPAAVQRQPASAGALHRAASSNKADFPPPHRRRSTSNGFDRDSIPIVLTV